MEAIVREGGRERRVPQRTCVGCGEVTSRASVVRFVLGPNGAPAIDVTGGSFGRGVHVHESEPCLRSAVAKGFSRGLRHPVDISFKALVEDAVAALDRKIMTLLGVSRAKRALAVGRAETLDALSEGAPLVVVACDAPPKLLTRLCEGGKALVYGDRKALASITGAADVVSVAVLHDSLSKELTVAILSRSRWFAWLSPEDR